jgi:hypothetical protein
MKRLLKSKVGQGTLEYILIAAAILALVGILVKNVKQPATDRINEITDNLKPNG